MREGGGQTYATSRQFQTRISGSNVFILAPRSDFQVVSKYTSETAPQYIIQPPSTFRHWPGHAPSLSSEQRNRQTRATSSGISRRCRLCRDMNFFGLLIADDARFGFGLDSARRDAVDVDIVFAHFAGQRPCEPDGRPPFEAT